MKMQRFFIVFILYTVNCYTIGKQVVMDGGKIEEYRTTTVSTPEANKTQEKRYTIGKQIVMDGGKIEEYRTTTVSTPEANKTQEKRYTIGKQVVYPGGQIIDFRNPNIRPLPVTPQVKMNIQNSSPTGFRNPNTRPLPVTPQVKMNIQNSSLTTTEKKICLLVKAYTKPGSNNGDIQVTQTPCNNGRNKRYSIGAINVHHGGKVLNTKKRSAENIEKRYSIGAMNVFYGGKVLNTKKRSAENIEKRWQHLPSQSVYGGGEILNFKKRNQVAGPGMKIINFKRDVWDDLDNDPRLQSLPGETIRKGNKIINW